MVLEPLIPGAKGRLGKIALGGLLAALWAAVVAHSSQDGVPGHAGDRRLRDLSACW
jgi:hypothetical protein